MIRNVYEKIKHHIWFWLSYAIYFYGVNKLGSDEISISMVLLSLPFFALLFYGISYLVRNYFGRRRYILGILLLLIFYACSAGLIYLFTYGWNGWGIMYGEYLVQNHKFRQREFIQVCWIFLGHFTFLAVLASQYRYKVNAVQGELDALAKKLEEETQRKNLEYKVLSAQVSPHMLVNVFQDWESQLMETDLPMKVQVGEMYEVMNYFMDAFRFDGPQTVLLVDEIAITKRYITIQEQVSAEPIYVEWVIAGNIRSVPIPPTTLVSLVMNVFKHGDPYDPLYPLQIKIDVLQESYTIHIANKVSMGLNTLKSHGLGLDNLRKRFDLVFEDSYSLEFSQHTDSFEIDIKVLTNKYYVQ